MRKSFFYDKINSTPFFILASLFACILLLPNLSYAACPSTPPKLPNTGETVIWLAIIESPIDICVDTLIPEGGIVNVEPGIFINVDNSVTLTIAGNLIAYGTPTKRITLKPGYFG
jgi:hypothetical protein